MADIRFITAQIGGGKSLFATIQICKELERTDRMIVTNVPLILQIMENPVERRETLAQLIADYSKKTTREMAKLEAQLAMYWTISEYCQTFISRTIDVRRRLVCLTEEQSREFWRYIPVMDYKAIPAGVETFHNDSPIRRSIGFKLPNVPDALYGSVPDFSFRYNRPGCYYVLDEVHQLFNARLWQQTGSQAERYMSQLRKLNDDLDLITQHPEKVDRNFRRNATEWVKVENMEKNPLFMGVTLKKKFRAAIYRQQEMPQRFDKPNEVIWYQLGSVRRYEWLYKTAEGVGVSGSIISEEKRFKGAHWSVWAIALAVIVVCAYFLPRVLMSSMQHLVTATAGGFQMGVQKGLANAVPDNAAYHGPEKTKPQPVQVIRPLTNYPPRVINFPPQNLPDGGQGSGFSRVPPSDPNPPPGVECIGIFQTKSETWIVLSDGRMAYHSRGEIQDIGKRYVKVFGLGKIPIRGS